MNLSTKLPSLCSLFLTLLAWNICIQMQKIEGKLKKPQTTTNTKHIIFTIILIPLSHQSEIWSLTSLRPWILSFYSKPMHKQWAQAKAPKPRNENKKPRKSSIPTAPFASYPYPWRWGRLKSWPHKKNKQQYGYSSHFQIETYKPMMILLTKQPKPIN